ncbi:MAG: diacylglycerol kinase family lipid kinase [Actinobacteria bacterium]|nr:diacylglycerol kinase family lipid kinase [Actinomycetota bacterium]
MTQTDDPAPADPRRTTGTPALGPARLIVNPTAGGGHVATLLPELAAALTAGGLEFDVRRTRGADDAAGLARAALHDGIRYLIAVGGDGTVHHVVNGMFAGRAPIAPDAVLGVCSAGSGSDFVRNFGLDRPVQVVARHLLTEHVLPIDVGVVELTGFDGRRCERLFVNIAEAGYGAEVVKRANRLPRRLGRVRYLLAAWASIAAVSRVQAQVSVDFTTRELPLVELVVANGQFFGGGMKVAPRAIPQDGRFSVLAFTGNRSQVFMLTTQLYAGEHLPHPEIVEYQSATCGVTASDALLVEADGELLGTTPARFTLLKRSLQLKI